MSKTSQRLCDRVGAGQLPKVRQCDLVAPEILLVSLRQPCQGWSVTPSWSLPTGDPALNSAGHLVFDAPPSTLSHWPRAEELAAPVHEEPRREPPEAEPSCPAIVHTERQSPRTAALAPRPGSRPPSLGDCISLTPSARRRAFRRKL